MLLLRVSLLLLFVRMLILIHDYQFWSTWILMWPIEDYIVWRQHILLYVPPLWCVQRFNLTILFLLLIKLITFIWLEKASYFCKIFARNYSYMSIIIISSRRANNLETIYKHIMTNIIDVSYYVVIVITMLIEFEHASWLNSIKEIFSIFFIWLCCSMFIQ